jgi:hypothetical protein
MDANQFFKSERKPVFHWFLLALLVFTIIDYLFVPDSTSDIVSAAPLAGRELPKPTARVSSGTVSAGGTF